MGWDDHGRRVVDETVLVAWWRDRMNAWPVHQHRLRQAANKPPNQTEPEQLKCTE